MTGGAILVDGCVGHDAGGRMRRGVIAVAGKAGEGFGRNLIAGSLFAFGGVGRFPGAGMKRGTIGLFVDEDIELLPSFAHSGSYRFPYLTIYLRRLAEWGLKIPEDVFSTVMERYNGDLADGGRGEVLAARRA
jgi:formylmethanofuran dehydrogenase subunit C